ncbi:MAG: hypothetical protein HY043_04105 [Verrucomicrobia bacterium]|nr:hypothetical protein [Verrucomicrobiota bacterium]
MSEQIEPTSSPTPGPGNSFETVTSISPSSRVSWARAYPLPLREREAAELTHRRRQVPETLRQKLDIDPEAASDANLMGTKEDDRVGVALSGGGIRSATFCLGVFQALAGREAIGKIDYLSTVSGGGYFGGFLGRLFTRWWINDEPPPTEENPDRESKPAESQTTAAPAAASNPLLRHDEELAKLPPSLPRVHQILQNPRSIVVRWLRDNGRYLSPNGAGDLWLALAAVLRNWVALQMVMALFILMLFLFANLLRAYLWDFHAGASQLVELKLLLATAKKIWWSPYMWLPLVTFAVLGVPVGWAFWITQSGRKRFTGSTPHLPWITTLLVAVVALLAPARIPGLAGYEPFGWGLGVEALLSLGVWLWVKFRFRSDTVTTAAARVMLSRKALSGWLAGALWLSLVLLAFGFVDSLGQSSYAVLQYDGFSKHYFAFFTAATGLTGLVAIVQKLAPLLAKGSDTGKFKLPLNAIANVAAFVVVTLMLISIATLAHAITWGWELPGLKNPPREALMEKALKENLPADAEKEINPGKWIVSQFTDTNTVALSRERHVTVQPSEPDGGPKPELGDGMNFALTLYAFLVALSLSWAFGRTIKFLNLSSQQSFYGARLIRAYLGASNSRRWKGSGQKITSNVDADDLAHDQYRPHDYGGPFHLINVTLNETVSGKSQVEYLDRKGLSLAVSPSGISAGINDHAFWGGEPATRAVQAQPRRNEMVTPQGFREGKFHALAASPKPHPVEPLDLGQWIAISGAAFTTGLGAGTSRAKSLLLGMANIRLGYWWFCGVSPMERRRVETGIKPNFANRLEEYLCWAFPVQSHLLDEFLARFHGPSRLRWYLSDGGHFENTAAYELIRRRVPFIIISDNGQDEDYKFEDLANLTRKARTDFGADIRFFTQAELEKNLDASAREHIGTLQEIRRAKSEQDRKQNAAPSAAAGFENAEYSQKQFHPACPQTQPHRRRAGGRPPIPRSASGFPAGVHDGSILRRSAVGKLPHARRTHRAEDFFHAQTKPAHLRPMAGTGCGTQSIASVIFANFSRRDKTGASASPTWCR